jgi:hypothetical protein
MIFDIPAVAAGDYDVMIDVKGFVSDRRKLTLI